MKLRLFISEFDCFQSYAWQRLVDLREQEPARWKWWDSRYRIPGPAAMDMFENFWPNEEKVEKRKEGSLVTCAQSLVEMPIDWETTLPWMLVESHDLACIQILNSKQKKSPIWCIWTLTHWLLSLAWCCWEDEGRTGVHSAGPASKHETRYRRHVSLDRQGIEYTLKIR